MCCKPCVRPWIGLIGVLAWGGWTGEAHATFYKVTLKCLGGSEDILVYPLTFTCQWEEACFGFDCTSFSYAGLTCRSGKAKMVTGDLPACGGGCYMSLAFAWYCNQSWNGNDCVPVPGTKTHRCPLGSSAILKVKPVRGRP